MTTSLTADHFGHFCTDDDVMVQLRTGPALLADEDTEPRAEAAITVLQRHEVPPEEFLAKAEQEKGAPLTPDERKQLLMMVPAAAVSMPVLIGKLRRMSESLLAVTYRQTVFDRQLDGTERPRSIEIEVTVHVDDIKHVSAIKTRGLIA